MYMSYKCLNLSKNAKSKNYMVYFYIYNLLINNFFELVKLSSQFKSIFKNQF